MMKISKYAFAPSFLDKLLVTLKILFNKIRGHKPDSSGKRLYDGTVLEVIC